MWVRKENSASVFTSQGDDVMVEHAERETLSESLLEVPLEEVISAPEKIPSMVKLDAPQLGKVVRLILGAQSPVGNGCYKGESSASDELVVPASNEGQGGRVESGHGAGEER